MSCIVIAAATGVAVAAPLDQPAFTASPAELLAELPADRDGLLAAAVAAVVEIDAAVMRGDGAAAELAGDRYEAIIWKLNGGTNFGCMADDEAAGRAAFYTEHSRARGEREKLLARATG